MKSQTIIVVAAAALGVFVVYRLTAKRATAGTATASLNNGGSPSTAALTAQWNNGAGGWGSGFFDQGI